MAQAYVGIVRWAAGVPTASDVERLRLEGTAAMADLLKKVRELPANLPAGCRLIGAWNINIPDLISFMVVEAGSRADLQAIDTYYLGWFHISWHPTTAVERN